MNVALIVVEGAKPARLPIQLPTTIGRSDRAKIKVRAALVSRTHCELYENEQQLFIRDLGSSNGTFVNGERITQPTRLSTDDMVKIGPVVLRVICDATPVTASAPADPNTSPLAEPDRTEASLQADRDVSAESVGSTDQESSDASGQAEPGDSPSRQEATDGPDELDLGIEPPPAVVSYEESGEGSVIHIEEAADFLKNLAATEPPKAGDSVIEELKELSPAEDDVDSNDSALDDFFKKLP